MREGHIGQRKNWYIKFKDDDGKLSQYTAFNTNKKTALAQFAEWSNFKDVIAINNVGW
jgi:hypothetical protein